MFIEVEELRVLVLLESLLLYFHLKMRKVSALSALY
jgi:hypothetical protein